MTADQQFLNIPSFSDFDRVVDADVFTPVAPDMWLGLSDVVGSTKAIEAGRYKAVNMAGAAIISAVMNALDDAPFAFIFGGDGASFLVDPDSVDIVRDAAARTARWAIEELGLELRVALVPIKAVREAGLDVTVARYAASENVSYAMFAGGGLDWAERRMKDGQFTVAPADPGQYPDLSGLSCRWAPVETQHGTILSLIVRAAPEANEQAFAEFVRELVGLLERTEERGGHPVTADALSFRWPPQGLDLEARAGTNMVALWRRKLGVWAYTLLALVSFRTGWRVGGFEPDRYRRNVALNSDFRKYDDGLRMTVDCHEETAQDIERRLARAEDDGIIRYGTHRQSAALMTCIVPSIHSNDHLHFLDGAGGGYATAAMRLKQLEAADRQAKPG